MTDWLLEQHGLAIYAGLFVALMAGAVGAPIPEDIPLIMGGVLLERGKAAPLPVGLACYLGSVLGDLIIFYGGRRLGPALFRQKWFTRRVSRARVRHLRWALHKRRFVTILVARHLFYLRSVTFLTCGAVGMELKKFLIADALAALVSVPIMISLGYLASQHYEYLFVLMKEARALVIALILFAGVAFIARLVFLRSRRSPEYAKSRHEEPEPPPPAP